jgi:multidrug efflux pump subunit AcrA (membrane-fusion protein)
MFRKLRKWLWLFGLPVVAAGMLLFMLSEVTGRPSVASAEPTFPPPTAPSLAVVGGIGIVEPKSEVVALSAFLPGVVAAVHVSAGQGVAAGAPLFTQDTRATEAALETAKVDLADARTQLGFYESVASLKAVSKEELSRRRFAVQRAQARVGELVTELNRLSVRAPFDGTVLRVSVRPGEFAPAGLLAQPLVVMGDVSTLHVRVEIDEENAARVKEGAPAYGTFRGQGAARLPLTFVRAEPQIKAKRTLSGDGNERVDTRVLEVVYALPPESAARVGQQMDVYVEESR